MCGEVAFEGAIAVAWSVLGKFLAEVVYVADEGDEAAGLVDKCLGWNGADGHLNHSAAEIRRESHRALP